MRAYFFSFVLLLPWSCSGDADDAGAGETRVSPDLAYQVELLELAAKAAHKFPLNPHIKNRSRAQARVAEACLRVERPELASRCIAKIANWRRGIGLADHALYLIEKRQPDAARVQLDAAIRIAEEAVDPNQRWRTDRVRARIARAYLALGDLAAAARFADELVESESGTVLAAQASRIEAGDLEAHLEMLRKVSANGNFDQLNGVMDALVVLFDKFYADTAHRDVLEVQVKLAFAKLPIEVRLKRLTALIEICLEHGDRARGLSILREASKLFHSQKWLPENGATERARLAAYWYRVGKPEAARRDLGLARREYDDNLGQIVDIYRASVLRQIAEAQKVCGEDAAALATYKEATEAGLQNPNSRPRAEDLAATCCSMAVFQVKPDAALRKRLIQICDLLGDPW